MKIKYFNKLKNITDFACLLFIAILGIFIIFPSVANKIVPQIIESNIVWGKENQD